ncbi:MAG: histidinol-phosphatase [Oscillospiraceae bacterium]|nr:histidinol-phosphatase [Oscillospiraceae bacterium]
MLHKKYQNLHTHTTYCDGKLPPEDMVKAAIEKGGGSIGFSEHSYVSFDEEYSMSLEDTPSYINEVRALKEKYAGTIDIFLGLELDYFTEKTPEGLEYIIGTTHHVEKDGKHITVDGSAGHLKKMNEIYFGGDYYAMAESYYATKAKVATKTGADIIGHFDLISKNNVNGSMFDETHPRYIKAALSAMEQILETCKLFEINTGAMYRRGAKTPYPSIQLLKELQKRGGEVILSSDSHNADSLYHQFDEMVELIKSCGFKHIKRLTKDGFVNEKI